jgi:hypothetical protein
MDSSYNDVQEVLTALQYLGITLVRDWNVDSTLPNQTHYDVLANAGIRFDMLVLRQDPAVAINELSAFALKHPGAVNSIEGPNEVDLWPITYRGQTGNAAAIQYQTDLYDSVKANTTLGSIPVYNLTSYPDLAAPADYGNVHSYAWNGDQPLGQLQTDLARQQAAMPAHPMVITESGYYTLPLDKAARGGVDGLTQATLTLNLLFEATKLGFKEIYLYELLDSYADPNGTNSERHFGLFDVNHSPKPAATAIHNLFEILRDPSSVADTFTTGTLNYSLQSLPWTAQSLLFQEGNGTFDIALWNRVDVWDEIGKKPISVANQTFTVDLGAAYHSVRVYDPVQSAMPIKILTDVSSFQVGMADRPLVIEVLPGAPAPTRLGLSAATDSGRPGDGITNVAQVTVTGTASKDALVTLFGSNGTTKIGRGQGGCRRDL